MTPDSSESVGALRLSLPRGSLVAGVDLLGDLHSLKGVLHRLRELAQCLSQGLRLLTQDLRYGRLG